MTKNSIKQRLTIYAYSFICVSLFFILIDFIFVGSIYANLTMNALKVFIIASFIMYYPIYINCVFRAIKSGCYKISYESRNFEIGAWKFSDNGSQWKGIHKLVSKFNKIQSEKYYLGIFSGTYYEHYGKLMYDTAFIIKHISNEIRYIDKLDLSKMDRIKSTNMMYENMMFESEETIKRRWDIFLKCLDSSSEEYHELLEKYNKRFDNAKKPTEIKKPVFNHIDDEAEL